MRRPTVGAGLPPDRAVIRMSAPPPLSDLHVAVALTVIYAWPVLRDQVLDVLEIAPEDRADADARIGDLLAGFVTGPAPGPEPCHRPGPGEASGHSEGGRP